MRRVVADRCQLTVFMWCSAEGLSVDFWYVVNALRSCFMWGIMIVQRKRSTHEAYTELERRRREEEGGRKEGGGRREEGGGRKKGRARMGTGGRLEEVGCSEEQERKEEQTTALQPP